MKEFKFNVSKKGAKRPFCRITYHEEEKFLVGRVEKQESLVESMFNLMDILPSELEEKVVVDNHAMDSEVKTDAESWKAFIDKLSKFYEVTAVKSFGKKNK